MENDKEAPSSLFRRTTSPVTWAVAPVDVTLDPAAVLADLPVAPAVRSRGARLSRHHDRVAFAQARALVLDLVREHTVDARGNAGVPGSGTSPATGTDPGRWIPREWELHQACAECEGEDHGNPILTAAGHRLPWYVSWAHTDAYVAAAVSRYPCGIDVETAGGPTLDFVLTREEQRAVRLLDDPVEAARTFRGFFTVKEAAVKCGLITLDEFGTTPAAAFTDRGDLFVEQHEVPGEDGGARVGGGGQGASVAVLVDHGVDHGRKLS
ncbi:4'-phosphopantetheinyl transferase family protein [Brevibacterium litoralis]|uniref:4'-phosphopantetheinyl transferase family protein n=1 Tax=Brevibacterium litoralis TaxID=3138935 RepID=UPI0032F00D94